MKCFAERIAAGSRREHRVLGGCILWCFLLLFLDQGSKTFVENSFTLHVPNVIIPGWFDLTYALNRGAAWSILEGYSWALLIIGTVVLLAAIFFLRSLTEGWIERYCAVFTVISGILGNSVDRLWRGAVVDFISVHYYDIYRYPIFNVADCAICIGICVFLLSGFLRSGKQKQGEKV